MKNKFKHCMLLLYPDGGVDPVQLRDLIRTVTMGWSEVMMEIGNMGGGVPCNG